MDAGRHREPLQPRAAPHGQGHHGLANVRFLRHCREFGLYPAWNLLYGVPGEEAADYEAMAEMLPALRFLTPPEGLMAIRLERFSPYFKDPESHGIVNVRPAEPIATAIPSPTTRWPGSPSTSTSTSPTVTGKTTYVGLIRDLVKAWMEAPDDGELRAVRDADGCFVLVDTRSDARQGTVRRSTPCRKRSTRLPRHRLAEPSCSSLPETARSTPTNSTSICAGSSSAG